MNLRDLLNCAGKPVLVFLQPDDELFQSCALDTSEEAALHAVYTPGEAACEEHTEVCGAPEVAEFEDWVDAAARRIYEQYIHCSLPMPTVDNIQQIIRNHIKLANKVLVFDIENPITCLDLTAGPGAIVNFYGAVNTAIITTGDGAEVNVYDKVQELAIEQAGGGTVMLDKMPIVADIRQGAGSCIDIERCSTEESVEEETGRKIVRSIRRELRRNTSQL